MDQPIYELAIVNEIMKKMSNARVDFYQRELSYSHCEVKYILETVSFDQKNKDQKRKCCIDSLPFCKGDHLVPLLRKLKEKSYLYYDMALQVILKQFCTYCSTEESISDESLLGKLFIFLRNHMNTYEEGNKTPLEEEELQAILDFKVHALSQSYEESKEKQKN